MGFVRCFLGHRNEILWTGWESGRLKIDQIWNILKPWLHECSNLDGDWWIGFCLYIFCPHSMRTKISWLPGGRILCSPSFKSLWISWSSADMKTFTKPKSWQLWHVMTIKSVKLCVYMCHIPYIFHTYSTHIHTYSMFYMYTVHSCTIQVHILSWSGSRWTASSAPLTSRSCKNDVCTHEFPEPHENLMFVT